MESLIISLVILIIGVIFNRIIKVDRTPPPPPELYSSEDEWDFLDSISDEITENERKFVNSERGENAPPYFRGYSSDIKDVDPMVDSSEKVIADFSPDTYVFNSDYDVNRYEGKLSDYKSHIMDGDLSESVDLMPLKESSKFTEIKRRSAINFNVRDAIIFSAILTPKFNEENAC